MSTAPPRDKPSPAPPSASLSPAEERSAKLRTDRRQQIVDAAKHVFAELGYHNASITEVIERAGIARGTFYLYFTNKRKVFDAILNEALAQLSQRISVIRIGENEPSAREQLQCSLVEVLSYLLSDRPLTQLLLNHGLTPDAESAARVEAFYTHVSAMIESSLREGIGMGFVRGCDPAVVAAGLLGAIRGIVIHMLDQPHPNATSLAEELLSLALGGVLNTTFRHSPPTDVAASHSRGNHSSAGPRKL